MYICSGCTGRDIRATHHRNPGPFVRHSAGVRLGIAFGLEGRVCSQHSVSCHVSGGIYSAARESGMAGQEKQERGGRESTHVASRRWWHTGEKGGGGM